MRPAGGRLHSACIDGMCWALGVSTLIKGTNGGEGRGGIAWAVGSERMGFKYLVFHFLKILDA